MNQWLHLKRLDLALRWFRFRCRTRKFTVVTNNCWGAHIYERAAIAYQTPFVGMFLAPACYLTLLQNLRGLLATPLQFQRDSRHDDLNRLRSAASRFYPIGVLGGAVELHFLHYASEEEAALKWARRLRRIAPDDRQLFLKFCDRDACSNDQLQAFEALPFENKVCFTAAHHPELRSAVWIQGTAGPSVPDGFELANISTHFFDAGAWITTGDGRLRRRLLPPCV